MRENITRRRVIVLSGGAFTIALAGCTGAEDEEEADPDEAEAEADEEEEEEPDEEPEEEDDDDDDDDDEEDVDPEEALEDEDIESTREGLEILEHELVEDDFMTSVEGVVVNNTGEELSYVEVGIVFYNEDGQRIDDWFTNTTDLPDGEEWAFEVSTTEDPDDIDDYTIVVTDEAF